MEAAHLKPVEDRIDRGINGLPTAGSVETGKAVNYPGGSVIGIPAPLSAATPAPEKAINSGYANVVDGRVTPALSTDMLSPSQKISNGQGKLYGGQPDNDEDDVPLSVEGTGTQELESSFASHRDVAASRGTAPANVATE